MTRFLRKVIQIKATDSPNVREAQRLLAENPGIAPAELAERSLVIPGLMTWDEYRERLATLSEMERTICLDAEFYEGAEVRLFPPAWFDRATELAAGVEWNRRGLRNCLGVDSAEGGDNTAWAITNEIGLAYLASRKTKDTAEIPAETVRLMREWRIQPQDCCFDRGGGGKQHADTLRRKGYDVRTVAFGESLKLEPKRGMTFFAEKKEIAEERYAYRSRRAEMYYELAADEAFAIPTAILNRKRSDGGPSLRDQLAKFPRLLDDDGRYWLPSKGVVTEEMRRRGIKTLIDIIGCSPDEADAVVVSHWVRRNPLRRTTAGAA